MTEQTYQLMQPNGLRAVAQLKTLAARVHHEALRDVQIVASNIEAFFRAAGRLGQAHAVLGPNQARGGATNRQPV